MFHKFPSLTNHYHTKDIQTFVNHNPELQRVKFVATVKIDGSNFGIQITPDGKVNFQSRNRQLSPLADFYNFQKALEEELFAAFLERMKRYVKKVGRSHIFYGELFGKGVQKRVDYAVDRNIRIFDAYDVERELWLPPKRVAELAQDVYVPVVGFAMGIKKALEINHDFLCVMNEKDGNVEEGIVIRPWCKNYYSYYSSVILKKKNEKFKESQTKPKVPKEVKPLTGPLGEASTLALSYVTENRLDNVISHLGEPESMKDFPKFIKEFILDYREDLMKEHSDKYESFNKKELKTILAAANKAATEMLKKRIMGL